LEKIFYRKSSYLKKARPPGQLWRKSDEAIQKDGLAVIFFPLSATFSTSAAVIVEQKDGKFPILSITDSLRSARENLGKN
jgi:hypothetical protein